MAFATEALLQEATAQLMALKKPKAIAAELGVSIDDVYRLNYDLKKSGKIIKKTIPDKLLNRPAKNRKSSKKQQLGEFDVALIHEIKRIEAEIDRLNKLMNVQDKVSPSFALALELKIKSTTETLCILQELQN